MAKRTRQEARNRALLARARIRGDQAIKQPFRELAAHVGDVVRSYGQPDPANPDRKIITAASYVNLMTDMDRALDTVFPKFPGMASRLEDVVRDQKRMAFEAPIRDTAADFVATIAHDPELTQAITNRTRAPRKP